MPFRPLRLCIVHDNLRGYTGRVVPRMKRMLEHRAFEVDVREVGDGPPDLSAYAGLILGTPVLGLGIKGAGPSSGVRRAIESFPADMEGKPVAIFCVYETRPGNTFDRMKNLLFQRNITFVAEHGFWVLQPHRRDHIIPAECMVRIR